MTKNEELICELLIVCRKALFAFTNVKATIKQEIDAEDALREIIKRVEKKLNE